jgi:hypothetical protein
VLDKGAFRFPAIKRTKKQLHTVLCSLPENAFVFVGRYLHKEKNILWLYLCGGNLKASRNSFCEICHNNAAEKPQDNQIIIKSHRIRLFWGSWVDRKITYLF